MIRREIDKEKMKKFYLNKKKVISNIIMYILSQIFIIVVGYNLYLQGVSITFLIIVFLIPVVLGVTISVMYAKRGMFDRIQFSSNGITTYRLGRKTIYEWDRVNKITNIKEALIIIYIRRINGDLPLKINLEYRPELVIEIKKYYSSEKDTD